MPRGTCQFCGCTDDRACDPPCWWMNKAHTVCSSDPCLKKYRARQKAAKK